MPTTTSAGSSRSRSSRHPPRSSSPRGRCRLPSHAPPDLVPSADAINHWLSSGGESDDRLATLDHLVAALGATSYVNAVALALADPKGARKRATDHAVAAKFSPQRTALLLSALNNLPVAPIPAEAVQLAYDRLAYELHELGFTPQELVDMPHDWLRFSSREGAASIWCGKRWELLPFGPIALNAAAVWLTWLGKRHGPLLGSPQNLVVTVSLKSMEEAIERGMGRAMAGG